MKLGLVIAVFGLSLPAFAQSEYAGPAILSRGEAPSAMAAPNIRFTPFAAVSAVWDSGLANVGVNEQGGLATSSAVGISLAWGIAGAHHWRRTTVGLSYNGSLDHYPSRSSYDSLNQGMLLGLTHQLTRRMTFSVRSGAGMFTRLTGPVGLSQTVPFDPSTTYIPTTDFFDNRTIYLTTGADLSYRKTARLSFDFGGNGAIVRRRSTALYGSVVGGAHTDVQYRITRNSTIGADYSYSHYGYTRIFGGTDVHQIAGTYALQLTRTVEFSGYAGAALVESKFVQQVQLDPAIAALLGITSASFVQYGKHWTPAFSARLSKRFHRGVAYIGAARTITPGNGLFLTSTSTTAIGGIDYNGTWKHWSLGTFSGYQRGNSIGGIRGSYSSASGGVSVSRQLARYLQFVMGISIRQYNSPSYDKYNRLVYSAHVGLSFSPGEVPLRIW